MGCLSYRLRLYPLVQSYSSRIALCYIPDQIMLAWEFNFALLALTVVSYCFTIRNNGCYKNRRSSAY